MPIRRASLVAFVCLVLAPAWAYSPRGINPMGAADASWKIHQTTAAAYPMRLMRDGVTHGEARVRVSIAADGRLLDALVISCSHRDFGDEALRTARQWRYEAEQVEGERIGVVGDIDFVFQVNGPVAIEKRLPASNEPPDGPTGPLAYHAVALRYLDHIPTPTRVVPPVYPREWAERGIAGSATVEFYIDESGQTRIPLVTAADHRLLGASAVAAVGQWRFEPPTRSGRPVLVRAEQVFTFQPVKK